MKHPIRLSRTSRFYGAIVLVALAPVVAAQDAEVVMVQGKVEFQEMTTGVWRDAMVKHALNAGQTLRTGDASQAAILVKDRTQVRLNQDSSFTLQKVGDLDGGTRLELTRGRMWTQAKQFATGLLRGATGLVAGTNRLAVKTPTATIGIRGTDWEVSVDDAGNTQVVVVSGEVDVSNDLGQVVLGSNEQSTVRQGMAPTRAVLAQARDRVQWVNAVRPDVDHYSDLAAAPQSQSLREDLANRRIHDAYEAVGTLLAAARRGEAQVPGGTWLLAADFALMAGDINQVNQLLAEGALRFPGDDRFAAHQARAALFRGDIGGTRTVVQAARLTFPVSAELTLVEGELARLDGQGGRAVASFMAATERLPNEVRAWQGLGNTLAEQEHFSPARDALLRGLQLAPNHSATLADLGALETRANHLSQAKSYIDQSLEQAPDDYVGWTSRGILLLTQGQPEAALGALLKAGLLEPRYAKAQIYTAIAWYQIGREDAAIAALDRAKKADPNDPLPYVYEAQIQRDKLNPMAALVAAREAMIRFPYLKSLGPIATDRQGSANLGTAYAMFGLEAWAQRMAQQSNHPFFAGSHLFAADRTSDAFVKNSSLLQGYLTDPTLFGASPQRSTLINAPGRYGAVDMSYARSDALVKSEPNLIANAYMVSPVPMAGFLQYGAPRVLPGDIALSGRSPSIVAALGFKPQANLGVFLYREEFRPQFDNIGLVTANERLSGEEARTQVGAQWQFDPKTALWAFVGQGAMRALIQRNSQALERQTHTEAPEFGLRYTALRDSGEWSLVAEHGKMTQSRFQTSSSRLNSVTETVGIQAVSYNMAGSWKRNFGKVLVQLDLNFADSQFAKTESIRAVRLSNGVSNSQSLPEVDRNNRVLTPNFGFAWSPSSATTYRLVYQDVTRSAAAASLMNQDTAGISLDVPGLESGGRLKRLRLQGEWELGHTMFMKAFADHRDIRNLVSENGSLLNETADISQLRRLRQQGVMGTESIETLSGSQAVPAGVVRAVGVVLEGISGTQWGWTAGYLNYQTQNVWFPKVALPDYPRHTVRLGVNWFAPHRWVIRSALTGRSERTTDMGGQMVQKADWDLALSAAWQDERKQRAFELFTTGQFRKDQSPVYGVRGVWRF